MRPEPDLMTAAALIGDTTRAAILTALLGGQSLPATELAYIAQITPQTASAHLSKLVVGGLLTVTTRGRHRYYRLKNAEVAQALEALARIAPTPKLRTRRESAEFGALRHARTCYDHLAGRLGVAVTDALVERGLLTCDGEDYSVTRTGREWLAGLDIHEAELHGRRQFAPCCVDWSERRFHVAGALGAAITARFFERGWIMRLPDSRAVTLTDAGREALRKRLGLDFVVEETLFA